MTLTLIIIALAILLVGEIYLRILNARDRKRNQLDRRDIDIKAAAINKRRNELDLWEHQIKGDASRLRHGDFFETAIIPAENNPSKKKARKLLASKFGYDVIDLIKIHEFKKDDGSAEYTAEFHILYTPEEKK